MNIKIIIKSVGELNESVMRIRWLGCCLSAWRDMTIIWSKCAIYVYPAPFLMYYVYK